VTARSNGGSADWGHQMLREGKYTPGQIDAKWTPAMDAEFQAWVAARRNRK
jgi:4-hydroxy-4-methyl-2-oxoglutarate aldolase